MNRKDLPLDMVKNIAKSYRIKICYSCLEKSRLTTGIVGGLILFKCKNCKQKYLKDREVYGGGAINKTPL